MYTNNARSYHTFKTLFVMRKMLILQRSIFNSIEFEIISYRIFNVMFRNQISKQLFWNLLNNWKIWNMHENVIMQWKHFQKNVEMFKINKNFCLHFKITFFNINNQISFIRVKMNTRIIKISIRFFRNLFNEIIRITIKITRVTINEIIKIAMIKTIILFIHKLTINKINNVCLKHFRNKNKFHERNSRSISSFRQ